MSWDLFADAEIVHYYLQGLEILNSVDQLKALE